MSSQAVPVVYLAPLVLPVSSAPIANAAVAVSGGVIRAVGPECEVVSAYPRAQRRRWDGVLMPGLVNAHTHLQYTTFAAVGAEQYQGFEDWSVAFDNEYESRTSEDWAGAARAGVAAGLAGGTTCFADVVTDAEALGVLVEEDVAGVAYLELMGVHGAEWDAGTAESFRAAVEAAGSAVYQGVGVSPHAPYSLDVPVLESAAHLARKLGRRIHLHLAESSAEDEYYRTGTGPLADLVTNVIGWKWGVLAEGGSGMRTAEFARSLGLLGPDSHVAHGVYLDADGRQILREQQTAVALCPRSNRTIGLDLPPVADYLREGGPIAVGTDSLASCPSLSLLEDVALLRQTALEGGYPEHGVDRRLIEAATLGGARAIGLRDRVGSLEVGKRADMAVFAVEPSVGAGESEVVRHGARRCVGVVVGGVERDISHSPPDRAVGGDGKERS
ncbi:MAG: amidohydrolase family protein [Nocardioidaceae bacterium]